MFSEKFDKDLSEVGGYQNKWHNIYFKNWHNWRDQYNMRCMG